VDSHLRAVYCTAKITPSPTPRSDLIVYLLVQEDVKK